MDEPFLSRGAGHRPNRKWDISVLSLISDSPRRRSRPRSPDLSSSSPLNPSSPRPFSRTSSENLHWSLFNSPLTYEQDTRYESSLDSATPDPRITTSEVPDGDSSYSGQGYQSPSNHQRPLHQIPEEEPNFFNAERSKQDDVEAPWSPRDGNGDQLDETDSGNSGDDGAGESELKKKQGWRCRAKELLSIAIPTVPSIPDVLHGLSSGPEHDFMGYPSYTNPSLEDTSDPKSKEANNFILSPRLDILSSVSDLPMPSLWKEEHLQLDPGAASLQEGILKGEGLAHARSHSFEDAPRRQPYKCVRRSKTAPLLTGLGKLQCNRESGKQSTEMMQMQSATLVVLQASLGLCAYLAIGVIIFCWKKSDFSGVETVGVIDALYFCIVTMCTIGYGDITPITPSAKIITCGLMFVGFAFIDFLVSGMLAFVLDRQEHLILTVVEDGHHERARNYVMDSKKGTMRVRMKVALAVGTVMMTIIVGVFFLRFIEDLCWVDAFYVTCISITTVGYGDYSFQTKWGRLFSALWLLLSTLGVARAFLFLAEARLHSRHRHLAKKILQKKVTVDDLSSIDLDNDGHISKSEFVVYKLKEMGRIRQGEIREVCKQFDVLDNLNTGKITLGQLLAGDG